MDETTFYNLRSETLRSGMTAREKHQVLDRIDDACRAGRIGHAEYRYLGRLLQGPDR